MKYPDARCSQAPEAAPSSRRPVTRYEGRSDSVVGEKWEIREGGVVVSWGRSGSVVGRSGSVVREEW